MNHSESIDKIAPALVKAQTEMETVGMSGENTFDKYKYAKLYDFLKVAKPILTKNDLCLVTSFASMGDQRASGVMVIKDRVSSAGKPQNACYVDLKMTLLHVSGQWFAIQVVGEGQDRADKSIYKAITGARKYGVAMFFDLVTTDDPEADHKVGIDPTPKTGSTPAPDGGSAAMPSGESKPLLDF